MKYCLCTLCWMWPTARLRTFPLGNTQPFRLIGVSAKEKAIIEWRWGGKQLQCIEHPWALGIWISSGLDEPGAERTRRATFGSPRFQEETSQQDWHRRLHSSHLPEKGAYSVCMHRSDAQTVSYSEITIFDNQASFHHCDGAPCCEQNWSEKRMNMVSPPAKSCSTQRESGS